MDATIIELLEQAKDEKRLVSIYTDDSTAGSFAVGIVDDISQNSISMLHISKDGEPDGLIIRKIEDIHRIDFGSKYEKKIGFLHKNRDKLPKELELKIKQIDDGGDLIRNMLLTAKEENYLVSAWLSDLDHSLSGFVEKVTDEYLYLSAIDENGEEDGTKVFSIKDIDDLDVGGLYEQKLEFIFANRNMIYNK